MFFTSRNFIFDYINKKLKLENWLLKIKSAPININMAKTEHLMSNLKSGGETYLRKIYTQEHSFKKNFFMGCLR